MTTATPSASADLLVVPIVPEQIPEAAKLAASAWDVPPLPGQLEAELASPDSMAVVAREAADPAAPLAGVATATILGAGIATADDTAVSPMLRGSGVGRRLIAALAARLRAVGVHRVYGCSSQRRKAEIGFFERCGFRVIGEFRAHDLPWFHEGDCIWLTRLDLD